MNDLAAMDNERLAIQKKIMASQAEFAVAMEKLAAAQREQIQCATHNEKIANELEDVQALERLASDIATRAELQLEIGRAHV